MLNNNNNKIVATTKHRRPTKGQVAGCAFDSPNTLQQSLTEADNHT